MSESFDDKPHLTEKFNKSLIKRKQLIKFIYVPTLHFQTFNSVYNQMQKASVWPFE